MLNTLMLITLVGATWLAYRDAVSSERRASAWVNHLTIAACLVLLYICHLLRLLEYL